ncbi:transporter substrate-binding domain-containing protein, partial [Rhodospirillaceae bacterium RKSG073]|nr:transporter substrate-binding domain-containing protein [Curvivirga aplysinae]
MLSSKVTLWFLTMTAVSMITSAPCYSKNKQEVIYITTEIAPYFYKEDGIHKGLNKDLVDLLSKESGYKINATLRPWARVQKMLERGDSNFSFMFKSPEREEIFNFSNEYIGQDGSYFFTLIEEQLDYDGNLDQLSNFSIGIHPTLNYGQTMNEAINTRLLKDLHYANTNEDLVNLLVHRRVKLIAGLKYSISYIARQKSVADQLRFLNPPINISNVYIAYSKKPENKKLKEDFDKIIPKLRQDGAFIEIY